MVVGYVDGYLPALLVKVKSNDFPEKQPGLKTKKKCELRLHNILKWTIVDFFDPVLDK